MAHQLQALILGRTERAASALLAWLLLPAACLQLLPLCTTAAQDTETPSYISALGHSRKGMWWIKEMSLYFS